MADEHLQNEEGSNDTGEIQSNGASGENTAYHSVINHEDVQKIRRLMYQDKTAAITEVVNLMVKNVLRQKEIELLHKHLELEMESKKTIQKTLLREQDCLSAVQTIEEQQNSMAVKLNDQCEIINKQIELCKKLRSQLKSFVGTNRTTVENLNKQVNEVKETANKQALELRNFLELWNCGQIELTRRFEQLQGENEALRSVQNEATKKYELTMKERAAEVTELSNKLAEMKKECCAIHSEKDQITEQFEQFKVTHELAISNLQQERASLEKVMKEQHDEQLLARNKNINLLEEIKKQLECETHSREAQLRQLKEISNQAKELEEQSTASSKQQLPKLGTTRSQGTYKGKRLDETKSHTATRLQSNQIPDSSDDLNIESYHHDNEISLLFSS